MAAGNEFFAEPDGESRVPMSDPYPRFQPRRFIATRCGSTASTSMRRRVFGAYRSRRRRCRASISFSATAPRPLLRCRVPTPDRDRARNRQRPDGSGRAAAAGSRAGRCWLRHGPDHRRDRPRDGSPVRRTRPGAGICAVAMVALCRSAGTSRSTRDVGGDRDRTGAGRSRRYGTDPRRGRRLWVTGRFERPSMIDPFGTLKKRSVGRRRTDSIEQDFAPRCRDRRVVADRAGSMIFSARPSRHSMSSA